MAVDVNVNACINCCTPVTKLSKLVGLKIVNSKVTPAVYDNVNVVAALNFIFKTSNKEISCGKDGGPLPVGLCFACWKIVFELYQLHKRLAALTDLNSLINSTFELIPGIRIVKCETRKVDLSSSEALGGSDNEDGQELANQNQPEIQSDVREEDEEMVEIEVVGEEEICQDESSVSPVVPAKKSKASAVETVKTVHDSQMEVLHDDEDDDIKIVAVINDDFDERDIQSADQPDAGNQDPDPEPYEIPAKNKKSLKRPVLKWERGAIPRGTFKSETLRPPAHSGKSMLEIVTSVILNKLVPNLKLQNTPIPIPNRTAVDKIPKYPVKETSAINAVDEDEDPLATALQKSGISKRKNTDMGIGPEYVVSFANFRYNGGCTETECTHIFDYSLRMDIRDHFRKAHNRDLKFIVDRNNLVNSFEDASNTVLYTKCGLKLNRDEITVLDIQEVSSTRPKKPGIGNESPAQVTGRKNRRTYPKPTPCPQCGRVFKWAHALMNHIRLAHEMKRNTKCEICGEEFQTRKNLRLHMKTHSEYLEQPETERMTQSAEESDNSREFKCDQCEKVLKSATLLKRHSITHLPQEERPVFRCDEPNCEYSSLLKRSLLKHQKVAHGETGGQNYICSRCHEGFAHVKALQNHQGYCCDPLEKPQVCDFCGKRFRFKQYLEVHYRHHNMTKQEARALLYPGLTSKGRSKDQ